MSQNIRPLGMPTGSVRALLALTVVALVIHQALLNRPTGLLLSETLLIVLAHYFASRRIIQVTPELRQRLEGEAGLAAEPNPLWLPQGAVRALILLAFGATAGYLLLSGRLWESAALDTFGLLFTYFGGVLFGWLRRRRGKPPARLWAHLHALVTLLACVLLGLAAAGLLQDLPGWLEKLLLALILFYFGSR